VLAPVIEIAVPVVAVERILMLLVAEFSKLMALPLLLSDLPSMLIAPAPEFMVEPPRIMTPQEAFAAVTCWPRSRISPPF
jgi:hypothetical protein